MRFSLKLLSFAVVISILTSLPGLEAQSVTSSLPRINEVELSPPGSDVNNQWIELCYKGQDLLNLSGWLIKSEKLEKTFKIPDGFVIQPNDYLAIPLPNVMFAHTNESVVLLTSNFDEVDRTPQVTDTFGDDRTWQRFPDCGDNWNFRNGTMGRSNGFPEAKQNFTLSTPFFVDQKGNKVETFNSGQMAGVKSEIVNQSTEARAFAYIVQVKDEHGYPVFISWVGDLTVLPGRTVKPTIFWLAQDKGTYEVDVFLWRSINNAEVLSPEQSDLLRVAG